MSAKTQPWMPFDPQEDAAMRQEAMKGFLNELDSLRGVYSQRLHFEAKRDFTTHEGRRWAIGEYLAISTLYHLVKELVSQNEQGAADAMQRLCERAAGAQDRLPEMLMLPLRKAYVQALQDAQAHSGTKEHVSRRQAMGKFLAAAAVAGTTFATLSANDLTRYIDHHDRTGRSPDEAFPYNLAIAGAGAGATWYGMALALDQVPQLKVVWQSLCEKTGLPEPALGQVCRAIDMAAQAQKDPVSLRRS